MSRKSTLFVLAALLGAGQAAHAQCVPHQQFQLLAPNGEPDDRMGWAVAVDGTLGVIGALNFDETNAPIIIPNAGIAYLYSMTTGSMLTTLAPSDPRDEALFGSAVAISGPTVIVGAPGHDANGFRSGAAYLFNVASAVQTARLLPLDGAEREDFGISVAIDGGIAIVGSPRNDERGTNAGAAYLFDASTGQQLAKLTASDAQHYDFFGKAVAIHGTLAVVTAWQDDDNGLDSGSAYVFDIADPTQPVEITKLLPNDGALADFFGRSVAMTDTTAIIGTWQDDDLGDWSGSAYLFDLATGQQIAKLLPSDGAARDFFGIKVDISGNTAIVGSAQFDGVGVDSGAAYLFDATTGVQIAKLEPVGGEARDQFGRDVAIDGDIILVGAQRDDDHALDAGAAYIFGCGCPADMNRDGTVDTRDFFVFLNFFAAGDSQADFNGDGFVDSRDFFVYLDLFLQDC